jgi:hypothetical protein
MRQPRVAAHGRRVTESSSKMSIVNDGPKAGNTSIEAHLSALEAAMERDRRFFVRHPFLSEYTREIMPGELPPSVVPKGIPASCEIRGSVTVRQIAPGLRVREFNETYFVVTAADLKQAASFDGADSNPPDGGR